MYITYTSNYKETGRIKTRSFHGDLPLMTDPAHLFNGAEQVNLINCAILGVYKSGNRQNGQHSASLTTRDLIKFEGRPPTRETGGCELIKAKCQRGVLHRGAWFSDNRGTCHCRMYQKVRPKERRAVSE